MYGQANHWALHNIFYQIDATLQNFINKHTIDLENVQRNKKKKGENLQDVNIAQTRNWTEWNCCSWIHGFHIIKYVLSICVLSIFVGETPWQWALRE